MSSHLSRIVNCFRFKNPAASISAAFGYGSGVVNQRDQNIDDKMIDFIFVVNSPRAWHASNLAAYPHHYHWMGRVLGPKYVEAIQNHIPRDGVFFNVSIPFHLKDEYGSLNRLIKYGVVSTSGILGDLTRWDHLYVAGRLHKPVEWIIQDEPDISQAVDVNLKAALAAALLILPNSFTSCELFMAITQLSYQGDPRTKYFEDNKKIFNIVDAQLPRFEKLYSPLLETDQTEALFHLSRSSPSSTNFQRDTSAKATFELIQFLPENVVRSIGGISPSLAHNISSLDTFETLYSKDPGSVKTIVTQSITEIVQKGSRKQTFKGFLSSGVWKSLVYSSAKFRKSSIWKLLTFS